MIDTLDFFPGEAFHAESYQDGKIVSSKSIKTLAAGVLLVLGVTAWAFLFLNWQQMCWFPTLPCMAEFSCISINAGAVPGGMGWRSNAITN